MCPLPAEAGGRGNFRADIYLYARLSPPPGKGRSSSPCVRTPGVYELQTRLQGICVSLIDLSTRTGLGVGRVHTEPRLRPAARRYFAL